MFWAIDSTFLSKVGSIESAVEKAFEPLGSADFLTIASVSYKVAAAECQRLFPNDKEIQAQLLKPYLEAWSNVYEVPPPTLGMLFSNPFLFWKQAKMHREYERYFLTSDDATVHARVG